MATGFAPSGFVLDTGRTSRLDETLVAAASAALELAPIGTPFLSGLHRESDTAAGSDGYAYRDRLVGRGIPVKSVRLTVAKLRESLEAQAVPPLVIPDGTTAAAAKTLRENHAKQVAEAHGPYATLPGEAWTWALVKVQVVKSKDGDIRAQVGDDGLPIPAAEDEDNGEG
jgi:hypothetical protein